MLRDLAQPSHLLILAGIIVVLFGWKKLPDAARSIGRSMRIFKSEISEMKNDGKEGRPSPAATDTVDGTVPQPQPAPQQPAPQQPSPQQPAPQQGYAAPQQQPQYAPAPAPQYAPAPAPQYAPAPQQGPAPTTQQPQYAPAPAPQHAPADATNGTPDPSRHDNPAR